jgi:hypothetical protein
MTVFLQMVDVPKQCFLSEVLRWTAFQRLPVASYDHEGVELHESREIYESTLHPDIDGGYLSDEECRRADLPNDPHFKAASEGEYLSSPDFYEKVLATTDDDDPWREKLLRDLEKSIYLKRETDAWDVQFEQAVEYSSSQIFVALRSGALVASGRIVSAQSIDDASQKLEEDETDICDIERTVIPFAFWRLNGIDFEKSSACNQKTCYFHITVKTEEMLSQFPGERAPVSGVERVGDSFTLIESTAAISSTSSRGRPSFPWDQFNLEVMELVRTNMLPQKKEAAIQHFQEWFKRKYNIQPSRAVIGEKLKPVYDRFMKTDRK